MKRIIALLAVGLLSLLLAGATVACSEGDTTEGTGTAAATETEATTTPATETETDAETDTENDTMAETDAETIAETDAETVAETETEAETTACDHTYVGETCSQCGATKTYLHTVHARYDADVEDSALAGQPIPGVSLVITMNGTGFVTSGTTDEKGDFTFEAPKYQVPDSDLLSYSVVVMDGTPEGYTAGETSYFFIDAYVCSLDFYKLILPDPNTAFNPQIVPIGSTIHATMPEAREGDPKYYYAIQPSKPEDVGYYRISISNATPGVTLNIGHYSSSSAFVSSTPRTSDSGEAPAIEIRLEEQYMKDSTGEWTYPNRWLIGVYVEGDATYPVEFDLTVERVRDLIPGKDYAITERTREQMIEGAPHADEITGEVTGSLTYVDTSATLVKDENGYYHVDSLDGPLVMLTLTQPNRVLGDDGEASFLTVNSVSGVENLLVSRQGEQDGLRYNWVIYYYDMIEQYAALCNEDGAYPLNEQLHDFLYDWVNQRASILVKGDLDEDHAYLVACTYYAE